MTSSWEWEQKARLGGHTSSDLQNSGTGQHGPFSGQPEHIKDQLASQQRNLRIREETWARNRRQSPGVFLEEAEPSSSSRYRVPQPAMTLQDFLRGIGRLLMVGGGLIAVLAAVLIFSPAARSQSFLVVAQLLSGYHSTSPENKVAFYEAVHPLPAELTGVRASVLYAQLDTAEMEWQSMSEDQQNKVAAAWLRFRGDRGAFRKLPPSQLAYFRAAFDSYISRQLSSFPDPRMAQDLAALRFSDMGGDADFDGFVKALQLGQSYYSPSAARESTVNLLIKWGWLARRGQSKVVPTS